MKRTEAMPRSSVAVALSVGRPLRNAFAAGWVNDTVGAASSPRERITTRRGSLTAVSVPSLAIASSTYSPAGIASVFTPTEKPSPGVESTPSERPLARNSTCSTPRASLAVAATVTEPETVASGAGAVSATDGGVASVLR